jgi:hypothetical protein
VRSSTVGIRETTAFIASTTPTTTAISASARAMMAQGHLEAGRWGGGAGLSGTLTIGKLTDIVPSR